MAYTNGTEIMKMETGDEEETAVTTLRSGNPSSLRLHIRTDLRSPTITVLFLLPLHAITKKVNNL